MSSRFLFERDVFPATSERGDDSQSARDLESRDLKCSATLSNVAKSSQCM